MMLTNHYSEAMEHASEVLSAESQRATDMLKGKTVARVVRHRHTEVMIEFVDGTRLSVDRSELGVELSITGP